MDVFWVTVGANTLGSLVGVGLALWHDRVLEENRRIQSRSNAKLSLAREEADQLRVAIWLVEENVDLAKQLIADQEIDGVSFFRMNTHLLDGAVTRLSTLCDDVQVVYHLEHLRYQLHHINAKMGPWNDAYVVKPNLTAVLGASIVKSAKLTVLPAAESLLPVLNRRLQCLSGDQLPTIKPRSVDLLEI
jgi:hypothetical protein